MIFKDWSRTTNTAKTLVTIFDQTQIVRQPKGVILVIGPWNYPINTLFMPLIAVMAAGNTAIVKPSEIASNTAAVIERILSRTFREDYLAVVTGGPEETMELLKQRLDHVVFTGSTQVGKIIMKAAAENLIPVTLELGGKR